MLMMGIGSNDAQSEAMLIPANDEAGRASGVSDIREILRPAGVPVVPRQGAFEGAEDASIEVDEGPLFGAREFAGDDGQRMVLVLSGELELCIRETSFDMASVEAVWVNAGESFTLKSAQARVCVITTSRHLEIPKQVEPVRDAAGRLREIAQWLTMELRAEFAGAATYRQTLLELLMGEWLRLSADDMGVLEKRLRAYVLEHIGEPISLEAVARHVGVGRYHLCRKYRRATGQSPMHAVRAVRLEQARELVATTRLPLRVVAKRVGLSSEQHLSRLLRSHFGVGVRDLRHRVGE